MNGFIYSLCGDRGEVLYVGQTVRNPARRFAEHLEAQPWADEIRSFHILERDVPPGRLNYEEAFYAGALSPKYGNWSLGHPDAPLPPAPIVYLRPNTPAPRICNRALRAEMQRRRITTEEMALLLGSPVTYVRALLGGHSVARDRRSFELLQRRFGILPSEIACAHDAEAVTA